MKRMLIFITTDAKIPIGDKEDMAFMSNYGNYGRGREGVVVETGMNTEIGKIAQILDEDNIYTLLRFK